MKKFLAIVAFAAATLVALPLSAADSNSNQRSITTMGTVNITIPADSAKLSVSLSVLDQTLEGSNSRLDEVLAALQVELKARGIPEKSVALKNRDVRKSVDDSNGKGGRMFISYTSSAEVVISIDDISKLSPLITYLKLHEEYGSSYPELRSSKIVEAKNAVLASALRIARDKAEILAKEGGAKLGMLLNATEENAGSSYSGITGGNVDAINGSQLYAVSNSIAGVLGNDDNDNDSDSATPTSSHVISINVRIRATFALE